MKIFFNDNEYTLENEDTLYSFLARLNINKAKGIAVAVNGSVVPKAQWNKYCLKDHDNIIMIKAVQGG